MKERAVRSDHVAQTARANTLDKLSLGVRKQPEALVINRMDESDLLVNICEGDPEFQEIAFRVLAHEIFEVVAVDASPIADRS